MPFGFEPNTATLLPSLRTLSAETNVQAPTSSSWGRFQLSDGIVREQNSHENQWRNGDDSRGAKSLHDVPPLKMFRIRLSAHAVFMTPNE